ncbi:hypothetical protein AB0E83_08345 [Streptomyces sp. NPDC035033]|uniref:hypothetical protein n=1 Tax=Streptomyces sp. NPDC035033 TaxID=3155368 RepID=UPI003404AD9C
MRDHTGPRGVPGVQDAAQSVGGGGIDAQGLAVLVGLLLGLFQDQEGVFGLAEDTAEPRGGPVGDAGVGSGVGGGATEVGFEVGEGRDDSAPYGESQAAQDEQEGGDAGQLEGEQGFLGGDGTLAVPPCVRRGLPPGRRRWTEEDEGRCRAGRASR